MTENQKLREALQHAIEDLSSATGFLTRRSRDRQSKTVAALAQLQADIALPTADHLPDAGEMVVDHFPDATKMIETAAPVGERLTLSAEDVHTAFVKHFPKTRISQAWIGFAAEIAEAIAARAALIAGDAGWQPIETAPKDGSDCWLLVDGDVRRGFWVEIEFEERRDMDGRYIDQTDADAYWMDHDSGDSLEPTMFYPITKPLPPSLVDIDAAMRKDNK